MKKFLIHFATAALLFVPLALYAQVGRIPPSDTNPPDTHIVIHNPFNCGQTGDNNDKCTLIDLIKTILENVVMPVAAVAVVIYIIYAGFTFVTAQGNPAKVTAARQRLLWALVGAGILLGAAGIAEVVKSTVEKLAGK